MASFIEIEARANERDPTFRTVGEATRRKPIPTNVEMADFSAQCRDLEAADRFAASFAEFLAERIGVNNNGEDNGSGQK